MARMTPPVPGVNTPGGEKIVFQKIKQTSSSINALHSLEIRDHFKKGKIKGEADFCVIYPNHGVFIIEVKGGEWEINNGQWYGKRGNTVQSQPLHESPFQQAEGNYYSISKKIIKQFPEMKKKLFGWGVVLPHASFPEKLFELDNEEWRVWDATNINDSFEHYLKLLATKEKQRLEEKGRKVLLPTDEDCENIKNFLRPDFECPKLIKLDVDNADRKIEQYTKDQFEVLDQMIDNPKLVIKGGAGTGKTLIAAEAIRRNIQQNKNVLFLCKNREITDSVRDNLSDEGYFALYNNYPTVKTWDSFLEHELLYSDNYINQIKEKYSNIGQYFNNLPDLYLKRCMSLLKDIEEKKNILGESSLMIYEGSTRGWGLRVKLKDNFSEEEIKESDEALRKIKSAIHLSFSDRDQAEKLKNDPYNLNDLWKNLKVSIDKYKHKLLDLISIEVKDNIITIYDNTSNDNAFERYYFSKGLKQCYSHHLDFLKFLKNDFSKKKEDQHKKEKNNENNKCQVYADFEIDGRIYFSDKQNKRPVWMHYHNDGKSFIYLNSDEISQYYHKIFSFNVQHPTKKQNSARYDYSLEGFFLRINNEIEYYNSENVVKFFNEKTMYDLYASAHPSKKYDLLIVDESQDIVKITNFKKDGSQSNLNVLHFSLKNGLFDGNWNFYLDPMQYSSKFGIGGGLSAYSKVKKILDKISPTYTRLTTNCRNTKEISKTMFNLCEVDKSAQELNFSYNINDKVETGIPVSFLYYNDAKDIPKLINEACKPLHKEGVKGKDIQILSMENAIKKYIHRANTYFDVYTSDGMSYRNERRHFSSRENERNSNYIKVHAFSKAIGYQAELTNYLSSTDEKEFHFIWGSLSSGVHYDTSDTRKSFIFNNFLSKRDTRLLIEKLEYVKNNPKILPPVETKFKVEDFENTDLFKFFTLVNPKIVSFHEKFFNEDKDGNRSVDTDEISLMFELDNWYKEIDSNNQIFIPDMMNNDNDGRVFCLKTGSSFYTGTKLSPMWEYSYGEWMKMKSDGKNYGKSKFNDGYDSRYPIEKVKENFIEFCEEYKDFEQKSAKHCTVFQFRGMDQKYVILTGFREITEKSLQSLYIGMSRAKAKLIVLAHKSLEEKIRVKLHEK